MSHGTHQNEPIRGDERLALTVSSCGGRGGGGGGGVLPKFQNMQFTAAFRMMTLNIFVLHDKVACVTWVDYVCDKRSRVVWTPRRIH